MRPFSLYAAVLSGLYMAWRITKACTILYSRHSTAFIQVNSFQPRTVWALVSLA